ncbi:hypothetical protein [Streptomyces tirandamycinicus]|uniref:Uncharacterized protein n=1 Tax=Streptomyces tirandamycinicus TaxID=2174846 RepID=A0A2S1ST05_9ACTN|nr:hypothetical protein [Streptomyces tirandamycinicus]AWI29518.1 hypothetical protein DDW44_12505 [Streptomyces tirandamycinicus]
MFADITVYNYPPADALPADVADAVKARDTAYDALMDFEEEWADLLTHNWRDIAEAKDIRLAVDATRAGKDAFKGVSAVAAARENRPRVVGIHQVLAENLRSAETAARRAFKGIAHTFEADAVTGLQNAAQAAEDAYRAYLAARDTFGGAANRVRWVRNWQSDHPSDYSEDGSTPALANGLSSNEREPIAEIRDVLRSYDAPFIADPLVSVRTPSGQVIELRKSQAAALVGSVNAPGVEIISA